MGIKDQGSKIRKSSPKITLRVSLREAFFCDEAIPKLHVKMNVGDCFGATNAAHSHAPRNETRS